MSRQESLSGGSISFYSARVFGGKRLGVVLALDNSITATHTSWVSALLFFLLMSLGRVDDESRLTIEWFRRKFKEIRSHGAENILEMRLDSVCHPWHLQINSATKRGRHTRKNWWSNFSFVCLKFKRDSLNSAQASLKLFLASEDNGWSNVPQLHVGSALMSI